ncbi:hypothetical protein NDU88_000086 [Pleurodeles waltl]|uniref:Uncharacterized protein n=1 Tax=Pleurodeles waltl TaxID=8319 RepID=A0AAV7TEU9_PLEWA|nr:hypothetical protein NDU88_000086 [Pleurodeles waltl]
MRGIVRTRSALGTHGRRTYASWKPGYPGFQRYENSCRTTSTARCCGRGDRRRREEGEHDHERREHGGRRKTQRKAFCLEARRRTPIQDPWTPETRYRTEKDTPRSNNSSTSLERRGFRYGPA